MIRWGSRRFQERETIMGCYGIPFFCLAVLLNGCVSPPSVEHQKTAGIPWDVDALTGPPQSYAAEGFSEPGVRALFYDGLDWKGNPTRVFAWYGVPEQAPEGNGFPAMVLVHGGGGTAFADWVRLWTGRGYAAIAMDTCGAVPRGSYGNWERHQFGGPWGWGGFDQMDLPLRDQWPYHAVADVILAHSLIRSFPEVDAERVGLTGISWGGYLTCIVAGVDQRFSFAVPVYGCGYYDLSPTFGRALDRINDADAARWLRLWDPSKYLARASMPFLWVTGTNDFAYPLDALQKSYRLPTNQRTLAVRIRMPHAHGGPGENPEEIHAFADYHLKNGLPLARFISQEYEKDTLRATFDSEVPVIEAELLFTRDSGEINQRLWESIPACLESEQGKVHAVVPEGTTMCFFNLTDTRGLVVSSEHSSLSQTGVGRPG